LGITKLRSCTFRFSGKLFSKVILSINMRFTEIFVIQTDNRNEFYKG
jgi:hypothetical protein